MIEPDRLPYDLHSALQGKLEIKEVPHEGDEWELTMHRRAAHMARDGVAAELSAGVGVSDYEFVGRLERRLRRAGAEDLVILLSNGSAAPAAATGQTLQPGYSVSVDLEYRGHWERIVCRHGAEASENQ